DRNVLGGGTEAFVKILAAMAVGGAIGAVLATRIQMTAMPQMVALLNGFGGGASALVAGAALADVQGHAPTATFLIATGISGLIGGVTFSGSLVAFDKLQEMFLPSKPMMLPAHQAVTALTVLAGLAMIWWIMGGDA